MGKLAKLISGALNAYMGQFNAQFDELRASAEGKGEKLPPVSPDYVQEMYELVESELEKRLEFHIKAVYDIEFDRFMSLCESHDVDPELAEDYFNENDVELEFEESELREESVRLHKDIMQKILERARTEISVVMTRARLEGLVTQLVADSKLEVAPDWIINGSFVEENNVPGKVLAWEEEGEW